MIAFAALAETESFLLFLQIIHDTVVDTSVVFPHRMGPPFKRALQTLMVEILQKIIQNNGSENTVGLISTGCVVLRVALRCFQHHSGVADDAVLVGCTCNSYQGEARMCVFWRLSEEQN